MRVGLSFLACWFAASTLYANIDFSVPWLDKQSDVSKRYSEPGGAFQTSIPTNLFECQTKKKELLCQGKLKTKAELSIRLKDVPKGANLGILASNLFDAYKDRSHFQIIEKGKKISVDGREGMLQVLTFDHLGSVDLPVRLETVNVIEGKQQLAIEFLCMSRTCTEYQNATETILSSLKIKGMQAGKGAKPAKRKRP